MTPSAPLDPSVLEFRTALLAMDRQKAEQLLRNDRRGVMAAVETVLVPALENIGNDWEKGELALAEVYMTSRICEALVDGLLPPVSAARRSSPVMAVAAFRDYHLLGKRLVYSMLRAGGYDAFDYGRVEVDELVRHCIEDKVELLFLSTLMLASAMSIKNAVEALARAGLKVRVAVGGAPFRYDPSLANKVNADYVGTTASDALNIVARAAENLP